MNKPISATTRSLLALTASVAVSLTLANPSLAATATTKPAGKPGAKAPATASGTGSAFCSQIGTSQSAIAASAKAVDKNAKIAAEWTKIGATAPAELKADISAVQAAYKKASTQKLADATATLATIAGNAKKIGAYVAANCSGAGGPGGDDGGRDGRGGPQIDPAKLAEIRACLTKNGVTLPEPGKPPTGAFSPNDPKFQAAAKTCGLENFGAIMGGPGGFGGRGPMSDAVRACVEAKGITLPQRGQGGQGGPPPSGGGQQASGTPNSRPAGGLGGFDEKTRAAIQACRDANP